MKVGLFTSTHKHARIQGASLGPGRPLEHFYSRSRVQHCERSAHRCPSQHLSGCTRSQCTCKKFQPYFWTLTSRLKRSRTERSGKLSLSGIYLSGNRLHLSAANTLSPGKLRSQQAWMRAQDVKALSQSITLLDGSLRDAGAAGTLPSLPRYLLAAPTPGSGVETPPTPPQSRPRRSPLPVCRDTSVGSPPESGWMRRWYHVPASRPRRAQP